ncbi:uncharacterized protein LOC135145419 [Zophobas morio]|uniref:uncharacterized protein LOC135145419 n=1 Tax=Zophobas morio TaxID=2755281 RepID=UPI0030835890
MGINKDVAFHLANCIILEILFPSRNGRLYEFIVFYILPGLLSLLFLAVAINFRSKSKISVLHQELEQAKKFIEEAETKLFIEKEQRQERTTIKNGQDFVIRNLISDIKGIVYELENTTRTHLERESMEIKKELNRFLQKKNSLLGNFTLAHMGGTTTLRKLAADNLREIAILGERRAKLQLLFKKLIDCI